MIISKSLLVPGKWVVMLASGPIASCKILLDGGLATGRLPVDNWFGHGSSQVTCLLSSLQCFLSYVVGVSDLLVGGLIMTSGE